ncbi:MAG: hypothetical protein ACTSUR_02880 [Candidatus Heimdallarchaeaceae archaeon]
MGIFYSQRKRVYVRPDELPKVGLIMAVRGGKAHVTVFTRKREAPGAGRPEVKEAFSGCAHATIGEPNRLKRNASIRECMKAKGLKTGIYHRKSRAKPGSPLFGKVYTYGPGAGKVALKEMFKPKA